MRRSQWLLGLALIAVLAAAGLIPARAAPAVAAASLVADGGFESGSLAEWTGCGGVRLADRQDGADALAVHSGRYALRMGNPTDGTCTPSLAPQLQAIYDKIRVPADATGLTLDMWYSRVGDFGRGSDFWDISIQLVPAGSDKQIRSLAYIDSDESAGWNHARWELPPDQVAAARGKTYQLAFYGLFSLDEDNDLAYFIDDIQVVPAAVRTPVTATRPADLADTNMRPLLGVASVGGKNQTVRADLDGSDVQPVYANSFGNGLYVTRWAPNGSRWATLDHTLQLAVGEQPSVNAAQISVLHVFNADGSGKRELMRTTGKKLVPGSPPGCRPPQTTCLRYDDPALDVLIYDFDWSPGGDRVAVNTCSTERYADGYTSDAICRIQIYNAAGGALQGEIQPARGVSWSSANRLLYRVGLEGPTLYNTAQGIWEADPGLAPSGRRLLFEHRLPVSEDIELAWAPDGRHFVAIRLLAHGAHYDSAGNEQLNSSLMLFDREAPDNPRQLTLVDYGDGITYVQWSPDGKYLTYSLDIGNNLYETYWLEVATGATGQLASDLIFAEWRPGAVLTRRVFVPGAAK